MIAGDAASIVLVSIVTAFALYIVAQILIDRIQVARERAKAVKRLRDAMNEQQLEIGRLMIVALNKWIDEDDFDGGEP